LNGLKAILDVIRVVRRFKVLRNPNSPLAPSPRLKDEPASGLDCFRDFKAAPEIRSCGPTAGGGYVLRTRPKVKAGGNRDGLLTYCSNYKCSHSTTISGDGWPDDVRLSVIEPRFICQACGKKGADVRPDFG
jgi:hypothetical protein